ncbi:MAG: hypothetical protein K6T81_04190 [Alicyclobacillus macrosporangiidus]|uniref:hypothetical protein n=1 Tax=Alicyclobacillus macrosporangiidus TaxID=392015 RepID=UPI0026EC95E1|nr:hypothetical protein [Alicyclobacillus macrosporangiidus]MCL6597918.1 hypothetical protein [Alicyclobacillus macrosporangiidus]
MEYRFLLVQADVTTHTMPHFVRLQAESLEDAAEIFAQSNNLVVDSIEGDRVWFVRKDDGTAHKYAVAW